MRHLPPGGQLRVNPTVGLPRNVQLTPNPRIGATSNFDSAESGSARWYELDQNGQPVRVCMLQGAQIVDHARANLLAGTQLIATVPNPGGPGDTRVQLPRTFFLANNWLLPLADAVQQLGLQGDIVRAFQRPDFEIERTTAEERHQLTVLMVALAEYWDIPNRRLTLPLSQLALPVGTIPLAVGRLAPQPLVNALQAKQCVDANQPIRPVGVQPDGPVPMPLPPVQNFSKSDQPADQATSSAQPSNVWMYAGIAALGIAGWLILKDE